MINPDSEHDISKEKAREFIKKYTYKYRFKMILSTVLSIPEAVVNIFAPLISAKLINIISSGSIALIAGGSFDFLEILKNILLLFFMYSVLLLCQSVVSYMISEISVDFTYRLKKQISEKIGRLHPEYFQNNMQGKILSVATNDTDVLVSSVTSFSSVFLQSILMFFGILFMMIKISWQMSLISFLGTPFGIICTLFILKKTGKYFEDYQESIGTMNSYIEETYSTHCIIRAFNGQTQVLKKFKDMNQRMYDLSWKSSFFSGFISPIMEFMSHLTYICICIVGCYFVAVRYISIGSIFAFLGYSNQIMKPFMTMCSASKMIQQVYVSVGRIFRFLNEKEIRKDPEFPVIIKNKRFEVQENRDLEYNFTENCTLGSVKNLNERKFQNLEVKLKKVRKTESKEAVISGKIEFRNVSFSYVKGKPTIKNFSLTVEPGQKVGIAGATGAGKTTIIKLLTGIYDVEDGEILIDGYNIKDFSRKDIYSLFGIVFQEPWLFSGSIMENIRYGNLKSSDEEVIKAAKLACADSFINALPNGYLTEVNELIDNISHGEKQLLTIARAILAKHKILILDEATASVDTKTEANIQKGLESLTLNKATFIVAHRLSTLRNVDNIVVISEGEIAEQGNHYELMRKKGIYYNMYKVQLKNGFTKTLEY